MLRRKLLASSPLWLLVACQSGQTPSLAQAITDASILFGSSTAVPPTGLVGAYSMLKTLYPTLVPANVDAQAQSIFAQVPGELALLSTAAAALTNATTLKAIVQNGTSILNLVAPLLTPLVAADPALAPVVLAFNAAAILMPFITASINQIAPGTVGGVAVPAMFSASTMTADQARAVLAGK